MCQYKLLLAGKEIACSAWDYLKNLGKTVSKEKIELPSQQNFPHDSFGLCIFHSKDSDWKTQNNYHQWLQLLLTAIKQTDGLPEPRNGFKDINLSGFCFIGKATKLKKGAKDKQIKFRKLKFESYLQLFLHGAHFLDTVHFEHCKFLKTDLVFSQAIFEKEIHITNCEIYQLAFNDAQIIGGVMVNKTVFGRSVEFCGLQVENLFQLVNSTFQLNAYFNNTRFNCDSFLITGADFQGPVDFSDCSFEQETAIEDSLFQEKLQFTNAVFKRSAIFRNNTYYDNVYFNSSDKTNKLFNDYVYFIITDAEEELEGKLIFENVNFYNIVQEDRDKLLELSHENKVTIGTGCIKYRVQTDPVLIETNEVNKNIVMELANSFANYFISSNGFNLGVEFVSKTINALQLFYYTDEGITTADLYARLQHTQGRYWDFTVAENTIKDRKELANHINNYVSKLSVLSKIKLQRDFGLWDMTDTDKVASAIAFGAATDDVKTIHLYIDKLSINTGMKIKKVIAQSGSQVNIADKISSVKFKATSSLSKPAFEKLKALVLQLDEAEISSLNDRVQIIDAHPDDITLVEKLKLKFDEFCVKHGQSIGDSVAASGLYEALKFLFQNM